MGPLSFDSGDNATASARSAKTTRLQWGRCLSTAEILQMIKLDGEHRAASMGPLSFDSGDEFAAPEDGFGVGGFNGAAVFRQRR